MRFVKIDEGKAVLVVWVCAVLRCACAVEPYHSLKAKNALVKSVCGVTHNTVAVLSYLKPLVFDSI